MLRDDIRKIVNDHYLVDDDTDSIIKAVLADLPVEKKEKSYSYNMDEKGNLELDVTHYNPNYENIGFNSCLAEIKKKWGIK